MNSVNRETWKPVVGYEGYYEVSSFGRVRSLPRMVKHGNGGSRMFPGKIMRLVLVSTGYHAVSLYRHGISKRRLVHHLVLDAFSGPCPAGYECAHWDGERANNHIENLRWTSRADNHNDKRRHGTMCRGESHYHSRLKANDVRQIRKLHKSGVPQIVLAETYSVGCPHINKIVRGLAWKHIGEVA